MILAFVLQCYKGDDDNNLEGNGEQDDGSFGGNTSSVYTYRCGEKQPRGECLNQFGNGWNKEGCEPFCILMWDINESRAHFNQSLTST